MNGNCYEIVNQLKILDYKGKKTTTTKNKQTNEYTNNGF